MDVKSLEKFRISLDEAATVEAGRGSYGSVFKAKLNGANCAVKRIHEILTGAGDNLPVADAEWKKVLADFVREINLLSNQRHPNIVQFLGVCDLHGDPRNIALVMEHMEFSLEQLIVRKKFPVSFDMKVSILKDTSNGVSHLHHKGIVHRDLNAGNVLLTSSLSAKVADLGISRVIDTVTPGSVTRAPGARDYMPPEALRCKPIYGPKLDCFSFGHLALYLFNEKYPTVFEPTFEEKLKVKPDEQEVLKRKESLNTLGYQHPLYEMVYTCLNDEAKNRWGMEIIREKLEGIMLRHNYHHPSIVKFLQQDLHTQVQQLQMALQQKEKELQEKEKVIDTLKTEHKQQTESEIQQLHEMYMSRLQQKERELLDKIRESQEKLMQCKETYQNQMQKRIDNEKAKCKDETDIEIKELRESCNRTVQQKEREVQELKHEREMFQREIQRRIQYEKAKCRDEAKTEVQQLHERYAQILQQMKEKLKEERLKSDEVQAQLKEAHQKEMEQAVQAERSCKHQTELEMQELIKHCEHVLQQKEELQSEVGQLNDVITDLRAQREQQKHELDRKMRILKEALVKAREVTEILNFNEEMNTDSVVDKQSDIVRSRNSTQNSGKFLVDMTSETLKEQEVDYTEVQKTSSGKSQTLSQNSVSEKTGYGQSIPHFNPAEVPTHEQLSYSAYTQFNEDLRGDPVLREPLQSDNELHLPTHLTAQPLVGDHHEPQHIVQNQATQTSKDSDDSTVKHDSPIPSMETFTAFKSSESLQDSENQITQQVKQDVRSDCLFQGVLSTIAGEHRLESNGLSNSTVSQEQPLHIPQQHTDNIELQQPLKEKLQRKSMQDSRETESTSPHKYVNERFEGIMHPVLPAGVVSHPLEEVNQSQPSHPQENILKVLCEEPSTQQKEKKPAVLPPRPKPKPSRRQSHTLTGTELTELKSQGQMGDHHEPQHTVQNQATQASKDSNSIPSMEMSTAPKSSEAIQDLEYNQAHKTQSTLQVEQFVESQEPMSNPADNKHNEESDDATVSQKQPLHDNDSEQINGISRFDDHTEHEELQNVVQIPGSESTENTESTSPHKYVNERFEGIMHPVLSAGVVSLPLEEVNQSQPSHPQENTTTVLCEEPSTRQQEKKPAVLPPRPKPKPSRRRCYTLTDTELTELKAQRQMQLQQTDEDLQKFHLPNISKTLDDESVSVIRRPKPVKTRANTYSSSDWPSVNPVSKPTSQVPGLSSQTKPEQTSTEATVLKEDTADAKQISRTRAGSFRGSFQHIPLPGEAITQEQSNRLDELKTLTLGRCSFKRRFENAQSSGSAGDIEEPQHKKEIKELHGQSFKERFVKNLEQSKK